MFEVLIETANRDPRQVRCLNTSCGIGRGEDNLVILQGWNIAKEHATLSARKMGVFIEVLSSRAPITVNGSRVQSEHGPLQRDDIVLIGAYRLRVLAEASSEQVKVPAQPASNHELAVEAPESEPVKAAASNVPSTVMMPPDMLEWRTRVHQSLVRQMDL